MIIEDVMDEQGEALDMIDGLRVHPYDEDKITPPAALIGLPTNKAYDQTNGRGMDQWTHEITILVSKVGGARVRRDAIAPYANGKGDKSVKLALERHKYTSCDIVQVRSAAFDVVTIAGAQYLGVVFTVYVAGSGG